MLGSPKPEPVRLLWVDGPRSPALAASGQRHGDLFALLKKPPYETEPVDDVAAASDALAKHRFDAILIGPAVDSAHIAMQLGQVVGGCPLIACVGPLDDEGWGRLALAGIADCIEVDRLTSGRLRHRLARVIAGAQAESQLDALLRRNTQGVVVVREHDQRVMATNPAALRLLRVRESLLAGQTFPFSYAIGRTEDLTLPEDEVGPRRELSVQAGPTWWHGQRCAIVWIRDVTAERAARELEQCLSDAERMALVGRIAVGIAHELYQPVSTLATKLDVVAKALSQPSAVSASKNGAANEALADCTASVSRVRQLVDDLRGHLSNEQVPIASLSLPALIDQALTELLAETGCRTNVGIEHGRVPSIFGESQALTQVLVHLLRDAIDGASPADDLGQPAVTVSTEPEVHGVLMRIVSIYDAHGPAKSRSRGPSAFCLSTLRRHGASVELDESDDTRRETLVRFPFATALRPRPEQKNARGPKKPGESIRILVVDDDRLVRRAMERILGTQHDVISADGGSQALDRLADNDNFDLVLCDVMMPVIDGPELYRQATELKPELADRFVFITGGAITEKTARFVRETERLVLYKPIEGKVLHQLAARAAEDRAKRNAG